MHKTNCMQSINRFQHGKYLVAYVLNSRLPSVCVWGGGGGGADPEIFCRGGG